MALVVVPGEGAFRDHYIESMKKALRASGRDWTEFSIHLDYEQTRSLYHIDKDGKVAKKSTVTLGPFPLHDGADD